MNQVEDPTRPPNLQSPAFSSTPRQAVARHTQFGKHTTSCVTGSASKSKASPVAPASDKPTRSGVIRRRGGPKIPKGRRCHGVPRQNCAGLCRFGHPAESSDAVTCRFRRPRTGQLRAGCRFGSQWRVEAHSQAAFPAEGYSQQDTRSLDARRDDMSRASSSNS